MSDRAEKRREARDRKIERRVRTSRILRNIAENGKMERIYIRDLLDALGDRAIGALMLIFAFPNCIPTPPGTSAILGAPLVFLAAQLAFGMKPWLPAFIANRSIKHSDFVSIIEKGNPWLAWAERLLRMRLLFLSEPPFEYFIGFLCLILAIVLLLPVPLGNMLPAISISIMAFGIIGRDGVWILGGLVAFVISMVVAGGVIFGMVKASLFFIHRFILG